jgi:hypothetical protein
VVAHHQVNTHTCVTVVIRSARNRLVWFQNHNVSWHVAGIHTLHSLLRFIIFISFVINHLILIETSAAQPHGIALCTMIGYRRMRALTALVAEF